MSPIIIAGIAGLASFIGITLFEKNASAAVEPKAGPTPEPEAPRSVPPLPVPVAPRTAPFSLQPLSPFLQPKPDGTTSVAFNPDGTAHTVGTPFVAATSSDAQSLVDLANKTGLAVFEVELLRQGIAKFAVVTTSDPSPAGDLTIRTKPQDTAPQVPGGGASKNGTVTVIRDVDATWSEVFWRGDANRPQIAQGFAKRKFLKFIANPVSNA